MMIHLGNQKGMGLLSILVSAGILSIIIGGVMTISQHMSQMLHAADIRVQVQEEMMLAQMALGSETTCTANFKDFVLDANPKPFQNNSGLLKLAKSPTDYTLTNDFVFASQDPSRNGRLRITSLSLKLLPSTANAAILTVDFATPGVLLGGSIRARSIPVQVRLDGNNKIVKCSALASAELDDLNDGSNGGTGGQGKACPGVPPGSPVSTADLRRAIDSVCDAQSYPMKGPMVVTPCNTSGFDLYRGREGGECKAKRMLGSMEGIENGYYNYYSGGYNANYGNANSPFELGKRRGYKTAEECKKQAAFSEGDTHRSGTIPTKRHTCINGAWTLTAEDHIPVEQNNSSQSDGNSPSI